MRKKIISNYSINRIIAYACELLNVKVKDFYKKKLQSLKCRHLVICYLNYNVGLTQDRLSKMFNLDSRNIQRSIDRIEKIDKSIIEKFEVFAENAFDLKGYNPEYFSKSYTFMSRIA